MHIGRPADCEANHIGSGGVRPAKMSCGIFRKPCQRVLVTSRWQGQPRWWGPNFLCLSVRLCLRSFPSLSLSARTITIVILLIPRAANVLVIIKIEVVIIRTVIMTIAIFRMILERKKNRKNMIMAIRKIRMSKDEGHNNVLKRMLVTL